MIDHEKQIYTLVEQALKQKIENVKATNQKLGFYKSTYSVVSIVQVNNYVLEEGRTFQEYECMNREEYEIEVQFTKGMEEIKGIMNVIDDSNPTIIYSI